jgi:hypothetical protein
MVESTIVICLLLNQLTTPLASKNTKPIVDLLLPMSPPQSASHEPMTTTSHYGSLDVCIEATSMLCPISIKIFFSPFSNDPILVIQQTYLLFQLQ